MPQLPTMAVYQFPTSFTTGSGTETTIGLFGATTEPVLSGALDNIYFNSESTCENSCTPTGNLYAAGRTTASATLYQIPITANVMGAANMGPVIGDPSFPGRTSPITEFFNSNGVTATGSVAISGNPALLELRWHSHSDCRDRHLLIRHGAHHRQHSDSSPSSARYQQYRHERRSAKSGRHRAES